MSAARILIVEDETTSREYMARNFEELGYEVRAAASGRDAIDLGSRFRPDVLVADWMLRNHYHGLDVCEALGQLNPELRTILITGFPSRDLAEDAERARVHRFLQKPFDLVDLEEAVRSSLQGRPEAARGPALGVVEVDAEGGIRFANQRARDLFSFTHAGREAESLFAVLPAAIAANLDGAVKQWVAVRPLARSSVKWLVRAGRVAEDGSRLVVLRNRRDRLTGQLPLVEALLDVDDEQGPRWARRGAVLVVERDRALRRTCVRLLRNAGATAYGVADRAEALRFLLHDGSIDLIVLDYGPDPRISLAEFAAVVAKERPDARLIGTAAENRAEEFRAAGIGAFLLEPWSLRALLNAVRD
jgi:CheY-like chemotaxis protein